MKHILFIGALVWAGAAEADCYADYKAKQDNPFKLHYGVMQLPDGDCGTRAQSVVAARLAQGGWTLLNLVSVSSGPPTAKQKADAGENFLRY